MSTTPNINDGGPAFPMAFNPHSPTQQHDHGMTLRAYAAIKLRVPDSGIEWLDAMIEKSLRNEFAGQALAGPMSGYSGNNFTTDECGQLAAKAADSTLAALKLPPT